VRYSGLFIVPEIGSKEKYELVDLDVTSEIESPGEIVSCTARP
jgi:hypothetical protein